MAEPIVLVVTSAGAPASAVVPVLAAIEAAGMRVRAIDVGGAGGGGGGVADRVRRAILGEGAERRLRRELEASPPDVAVVFDPHAALALTVARDQVASPAPVIGVVAELDPDRQWSSTDADRFAAIDDLAAVALADAGVEGDRILVVGPIGERAFVDAAATDRAGLRARFKLTGKVALVEVAGLGAELTGQLAMQLSLMASGDSTTFLFDAGSDVEAAAVLRRQVPALGLRAKLFGQTADAPLLWRCADAIVARPRPASTSRALLLGAPLVALLDDGAPAGARLSAALEARKRCYAVKSLLLVAGAIEVAFKHVHAKSGDDGAEIVADIAAVIAADKRAVIDERRAAAHAATRDRVRAATTAASAVAAAAAMPGDLEDLSGGVAAAAEDVELPDEAELARLRNEVKQRVVELTKAMAAARAAADDLAAQAKQKSGDDAAQLERKSDGERARMHALLSELGVLETELRELERVSAAVASAPPRAKSPPRPTAFTADDLEAATSSQPPPSIDDALAEMKRKAGGATPASSPRPTSASSPSSPSSPSSATTAPRPRGSSLEDELAALKRKMTSAPPKKK